MSYPKTFDRDGLTLPSLSETARHSASGQPLPHTKFMHRFTCDCGAPLFFGNTQCLTCERDVGYEPATDRMVCLTPEGSSRRCANAVHGVCNWLLPRGSAAGLCSACRLNRTIPNLDSSRNIMLWARMEMAKKRLIRSLLRLGFTVPSKKDDALNGMAFDIVSTVINPKATTGHLNGVITVNLEEADDTYRQINRQQLGESSRTLLGHFRHESAHYVWHRFFSSCLWNDPLRLAFRERFGDERADYAQAMGRYYNEDAPSSWESHFISRYATSHPWEDWAETWAHYLQILDVLETCTSLGVHAQILTLPPINLRPDAALLPSMLPQPPASNAAFLTMIERWMQVSTALNEVSDSVGEPPLYPFVISTQTAKKLRLAHHLAETWSAAGDPVA